MVKQSMNSHLTREEIIKSGIARGETVYDET